MIRYCSFDAKQEPERVGFQSAGSAPTDSAPGEAGTSSTDGGAQPSYGRVAGAETLDVALAEKVRAITSRTPGMVE